MRAQPMKSGDAADACCPPDARGAAGTGHEGRAGKAGADARIDGGGQGERNSWQPGREDWSARLRPGTRAVHEVPRAVIRPGTRAVHEVPRAVMESRGGVHLGRMRIDACSNKRLPARPGKDSGC